MTNIQDKIDKWFIDTSKGGQKIPQTRHTWARVGEKESASNVRPYAHATVEPVYEGDEYMKRWTDSIKKLTNHPNPPKNRIYHAAWKIEDVETLGVGSKQTPSLLLKFAKGDGVNVYLIASGHAGGIPNAKFVRLLTPEIMTCGIDTRYSGNPVGSIHQKFTIFKTPEKDWALVGSIDINKDNWGRRPHNHNDPKRPEGPMHNIGVKIEGDILSDLEWEFVQRYRDKTRNDYAKFQAGPPYLFSLPDLSKSEEPPALNTKQGKHRVQLLLTYGRGNGYSWSNQGEFTIWASYINAIKKAEKYLYIEDQYFLPFGRYHAPWYNDTRLQEFCPFYQLAEAIRKGVNVIVVVAPPINIPPMPKVELDTLTYKREQGIRYLRSVAASDKGNGDFHIALLSNRVSYIYVHSKLMLCDDEFTLLGSANFSQRSLTNDGELQLGIIDEEDKFTKNVRTNLWNEHLDGEAMLTGPLSSQIKTFTTAIKNSWGRLRKYPKTKAPSGYLGVIDGYADPYNGPDIKSLMEKKK